MNPLASALHDATHLVPGVPAHSDTPAAHGERPASHGSRRTPVSTHRQNRHPHPQNRHHQNPPRILISWQNWIGRLVDRNRR